jgi:hypothetical protein
MQASDIWFDESLTVTRVIDLDELSPGVNVFTVFDPNNRPVAERLFSTTKDSRWPQLMICIRKK